MLYGSKVKVMRRKRRTTGWINYKDNPSSYHLPTGQACALHKNGSKDSHVVRAHDWCSSEIVASTHSPIEGSGCGNAQNPAKEKIITHLLHDLQEPQEEQSTTASYSPAYCETSRPAADSRVLVRRSSKEARPNQYC